MNVLVIAAHPDDEILGCGATTRRLADEGHHVFSIILCADADARHGRPELETLHAHAAAAARAVGIQDTIRCSFGNIRFNSVPHIEIVREIEQAIVTFQPKWVFTHHAGDLNVDHRVCHETAMAAVMLPQRLSTSVSPKLIERVYTFEVLSSTDWAPTFEAFRPNSFFDVAATIDAKVAALESFEGALKPVPHSRSAENVRHLAALRGAQIGVHAAEAFMLVRDANY